MPHPSRCARRPPPNLCSRCALRADGGGRHRSAIRPPAVRTSPYVTDGRRSAARRPDPRPSDGGPFAGVRLRFPWKPEKSRVKEIGAECATRADLARARGTARHCADSLPARCEWSVSSPGARSARPTGPNGLVSAGTQRGSRGSTPLGKTAAQARSAEHASWGI